MARLNAKRFALISPAMLVLVACSGSTTPQADPEETVQVEDSLSEEAEVAQISDNGPAAFAQCAVCHKVDKAEPQGIGPHLAGLLGTEAGSRGDYNYSPALKNSGIVWDAETLEAFIKSPQQTVSGTRMAFGGVADEVKRTEIVDFLARLD